MTHKYAVKKNIDKSGGADNVQYYATSISSGIVSTKELADILTQRSSLTAGDVVSTLIGLSELVQEKLQQGYKVRLDGIGILSLSVTSDGYDTPEGCTPSRVRAKRVCFRADTDLKKSLKKIKFRRADR